MKLNIKYKCLGDPAFCFRGPDRVATHHLGNADVDYRISCTGNSLSLTTLSIHFPQNLPESLARCRLPMLPSVVICLVNHDNIMKHTDLQNYLLTILKKI